MVGDSCCAANEDEHGARLDRFAWGGGGTGFGPVPAEAVERRRRRRRRECNDSVVEGGQGFGLLWLGGFVSFQLFAFDSDELIGARGRKIIILFHNNPFILNGRNATASGKWPACLQCTSQ